MYYCLLCVLAQAVEICIVPAKNMIRSASGYEKLWWQYPSQFAK